MRSIISRTVLSENSFHQLPMHVRQSITPTLKSVRQSFVVDAQQVHDRGVQVVDVQSISRDVVSELIRGTVHGSCLYAATSHPDAETARMVIASKVG